jgi:hypothetical protein
LREWVRGQPQPYLRGHAAWKDRGPKWIVNENGCWIWQRSINKMGYAKGAFASRGAPPRQVLVHRYLYEQKFGPVPADVPIDHRCHTDDRENCPGGRQCPHRACVNPDHGEAVTVLQNVHRAVTTKAQEIDISLVYLMRCEGTSWRRIAARLNMTHPPLITRLRKYCERNGLAYP